MTQQRVPISTLEEILHEDLERGNWVEPPKNPFVMSAKNLGGAELFSGGINAAATYLTSLATANPWYLGASGPVFEKFGFLIWEAGKALRTKDATWSHRFSQGVKGFGTTLAADLFGHDPTYIGLMQFLLAQGVTPAFASGLSFLAGIPVAATLQSGAGAVSHRAMRETSKRFGFQWEKRYFETRFLVLSDQDPKEAFEAVREKFSLGEHNISDYHDVYHEHRFPAFGNRLGLVRLRDVKNRTQPERSYTDLEVTYTFPKKESRRRPEYNLPYVDKEKGFIDLRKGVSPHVSRLIRPTTTELSFERSIHHDDEIRIVHDTVRVDDDRSFSLIELKAYHESPQFFEAMVYLLRHASVIPTTYPKIKLVSEIRKRS